MDLRLPSIALLVSASAAFGACSSSNSGTSSSSSGDVDSGADADVPVGTQCSAARKAALPPIEKVSTGEVSVLGESGGAKKIYIDASAGGFNNASKNPRLYLNLERAEKVSVTDSAALESTDWDLALKRVTVFTNSGDGGPGVGGAVAVVKDFASVTAADAAKLGPEKFFDENCELQKEQLGGPFTTFSNPPPFGWYDYNEATMVPTPRPGVTYLVKGGTGKLYKLAIRAYDALPDGGSRNNMSTGFFVLEVAAL